MVTMWIGVGWLLTPALAADAPSRQGDLTITEFMAEPQEVPNYTGEWFEIYNASGKDLDLNGLRVSGTGGVDAGFTVSGTLVLAAGDYAVFGVGNCSSYTTCGPNEYNGGIVLDYLYSRSSFELDEDGDTIRLSVTTGSGTVVLDTVTWDPSGWPTIRKDYALQANINAFDLEWANDISDNWCDADTLYGNEALYGTPGKANQPCDGSTLDGDGDGYTEATGDCDDSDPTVNPDALDGDAVAPECPEALPITGRTDDDADCDGVRDDGAIDDDGDGYTEEEGDCDDTDPDANPSAVERGGQTGVDDDCNGCVDDIDDDNDGFTECPAWHSICDASADDVYDCDDTDRDINPNEPDTPYDGLDNDCDGYDICDVDGDGYLADPAVVCPGEDCCTEGEFVGHPDAPLRAGDCDDNNADVNPLGTEGDPSSGGFADGLDNDCNGVVDDPYQDRDGDGYAAIDGDCLDDPADPQSALVYPGQPEICGDFYDNDCDGLYDDGCENQGQYATIQGGRICGLLPDAASGGMLLAALALAGALGRRRQNRGE